MQHLDLVPAPRGGMRPVLAPSGRVSMHRLYDHEDHMTCLEGYFTATQRPPHLQTYLRGVAGELFSRSVVVGYFVDGKMMGGFSLVTKPPVPVLDMVPDDVRSTHPFLSQIDESDVLSVSLLWLDKELRGFVHSARLWLCLLSTVRELDRPYFMYSYVTRERRNWQLYRRGGRSTNIYQGMLKNGAEGGVDYLPLHHLKGPIDFLTGFLGRHPGAEGLASHFTRAGSSNAMMKQKPSSAALT